MRNITFLIILLILASCENKHRASLGIVNKMDSGLLVKIYSNQKYSHGDLYRISEDGGGYNAQMQLIQPADQEIFTIFDTYEWDKEPGEVLNHVVDSISIKVCKGDSIELFFSTNELRNYKYNLLVDNFIWRHVTKTLTFPTMFRKNETKYEFYYFDIDSTRINHSPHITSYTCHSYLSTLRIC